MTDKPKTIAQAYAEAMVEAIRRTNEVRAETDRRLAELRALRSPTSPDTEKGEG